MEPVKVKQEPNTDDNYSCPSSSSVKTERSKDGRSACMVGIPTVLVSLPPQLSCGTVQLAHATAKRSELFNFYTKFVGEYSK